MAFFLSPVKYEHVLFAASREGTSKAGKQFMTVTVVDDGGNTNQISTSNPDTMQVFRSCKAGDYLDLQLTVAGGPNKQYVMIANVPDSVMPSALPIGY